MEFDHLTKHFFTVIVFPQHTLLSSSISPQAFHIVFSFLYLFLLSSLFAFPCMHISSQVLFSSKVSAVFSFYSIPFLPIFLYFHYLLLYLFLFISRFFLLPVEWGVENTPTLPWLSTSSRNLTFLCSWKWSPASLDFPNPWSICHSSLPPPSSNLAPVLSPVSSWKGLLWKDNVFSIIVSFIKLSLCVLSAIESAPASGDPTNEWCTQCPVLKNPCQVPMTHAYGSFY